MSAVLDESADVVLSHKVVTVCCPILKTHKGAWQVFHFFICQSEGKDSKTQGQNDCHQAEYIINAAMPSFLLALCTCGIISIFVQHLGPHLQKGDSYCLIIV